jgi:hypothetical protein
VRQIGDLLRSPQRTRGQGIGDACPWCGVAGRVDAEAFRWEGERHLSSVCQACGRTWTTTDRHRTEDLR